MVVTSDFGSESPGSSPGSPTKRDNLMKDKKKFGGTSLVPKNHNCRKFGYSYDKEVRRLWRMEAKRIAHKVLMHLPISREEKEKAIAVTKAQQEFEVAELEAKKAKQVALKVQAEGEAKAAANRALVAAGLTPAERAEWDYKTAVGVAQALAESKVSWVPSVMFGGGSSSNSAMDAVGLKMLLDITKSLDKTSK